MATRRQFILAKIAQSSNAKLVASIRTGRSNSKSNHHQNIADPAWPESRACKTSHFQVGPDWPESGHPGSDQLGSWVGEKPGKLYLLKVNRMNVQVNTS